MQTPTLGTSALLEPLEVSGVRFKNRIVMAPMGSCQSDRDGFVTDQTVAYYRRRAEGGVGGITVEAALVTPEVEGHEPQLHGPEHVPGMRRVADAIRAHGAAVGIQLMHPGRQVTSGRSVAPSAVPLNSMAPVPEVLTIAEIDEIVERYAAAARLAQEAGFQYVEVHGAHGYLPSDFLSPVVNQRDDGYGGSVENRARFTLEVARAIIDATEIPLFWRLGGEELTEGGYGIEQQRQVARWLEEAGVACLSVSAGTWHTLHVTVAPMYVERGHMIKYAAAIKQAVSIPVIAVGRLDDPALAESVVANGSADLILLGRGLVADADWTLKLEDGRRDDIRPCIACNACVDLVARGLEMRCAVNAETGRESRWAVVPAAQPRRVMVIGGGPAGMEAARVAQIRGHEVSLWEKDDVIGGKLDVASRAPSKSEVLRFRDYAVRTLAGLGVGVHTGVEVTAEDVERENPDVVVIATGAAPLFPPIPGVDSPNVIDAQELLYRRVPIAPGARVVIVGGSATGCETAELLVEAGAGATIIELLGTIGQGIEQITRRHLVRVLRKAGVQILTKSKVTAIEQGRVLYESADGTPGFVEADLVALAVGWRPRGEQLSAALGGREVLVLGDAERAADFVAATAAGARAGRTV
jgi:2,4-dienoyl-CoA reductase-like NADH-dependent reductase (Old Yellow Enzyme family)/NADPH-dependent 2,4-dienoyl-CoA reductase/sulfur reductase-like enzyme